MKHLFYMLILATMILGCEPKKNSYDIIITDSPANMKELNSPYDDYNSDLKFPHQRTYIYFSSNRNSQGAHFDIVENPLDFSYHSEDDILNLSIPNDNYSSNASMILPVINSTKNEYGPYSFLSGNSLIFMYSTDSTLDNKHDIKYVELTNWDYGFNQTVSSPKSIAALNTYQDNLYPSLTQDGEAFYFCSNYNDTIFNIFKADYQTTIDISQLENNTDVAISKDTILSSKYNDKCPFINKNLMVFTSDRKDGFGGYDLWYSYYQNNSWSAPINFGNEINSPYDEFRPITFQIIGYDVMIFSSNRPNGKGGFDLYIVKISNMIK